MANSGSALVVLFVSMAVVHRVANRMLLVPLQQYTQFLALATAAVQLAGYSTLCRLRIGRGDVTPEMVQFSRRNWALMAAIGVCEGVFYPLVMFSAARLPGGLVQVLNQVVVPATVAFSAVLLGRRYGTAQLAGVALVLAGVLLAGIGPGAAAVRSVALGWAVSGHTALCLLAYVLLALGVTLKDVAFTRFKREHKGDAGGLDVSLVCTAAALAQFAVQLLAWPALLALAAPGVGGVRFMLEGAKALAGAQEPLAPWLALTYWTCNISFSLVCLQLVRRASAATVVLANVTALPLSAMAFCLPLPLLQRQAFNWHFVGGLVAVVAGNLAYGRAGLRQPPRAAAAAPGPVEDAG